jgi:large subunit ribosomal protein L13
MNTYLAKNPGADRQWFVVDAADKPVGRLAVRVAAALRGKTRPSYTPHVDTGDFVVVINAATVKLTGRKNEKKIYQQVSGWRGGQKRLTANEVREKHPDRLIKQAVKGMLPKSHLSRALMRRLKVYPGSEHPHAAQQPVAME